MNDCVTPCVMLFRGRPIYRAQIQQTQQIQWPPGVFNTTENGLDLYQ